MATADTSGADEWRENEPAARQLRRLAARQAAGHDPAGAYDAALALGIEGEREIGPSLERRLAGTGAIVDHSIQFLRWGDIDHLVVGPGGVTVVDAKKWSGEVTVRNGVPCVGSRRRPREVRKLARQCDAVRLALVHAPPALRNTSVRGVMCFAGDSQRAAEDLAGGLVLGGDAVAAEIASRPGPLSAREVADLRAILLARIPRVTRAELSELQAQPIDVPPERRAPAAARKVRRRRRRARRRLADQLASAVLSVAIAAAAYLVITHLRLKVSSPPPRVSQLSIGRLHGRVVVKFTAPAAADVKFTLVGSARRKTVRAKADGVQEFWVVPPRWARATRLTVHACVMDDRGACVSKAVTARRR